MKFKNQFREIEILKNQVQIDRGIDSKIKFVKKQMQKNKFIGK